MNITGIFAVGLIVVGGMFYWYFDHSQKIIHQLEADNATLVVSVQSQKDAISALQLHTRDQTTQVKVEHSDGSNPRKNQIETLKNRLINSNHAQH